MKLTQSRKKQNFLKMLKHIHQKKFFLEGDFMFNEETLAPFPLMPGTKQECFLSPLLFNMFCQKSWTMQEEKNQK